MKYLEAMAIIKEEYDIKIVANHAILIYTGLTYDGCNSFCVVLYNLGDKAILTDLGRTNEVFDEVGDETWIELCDSHGFEFNHWRIQKDFNSIDDVDEFIKFLDFISVKFFDEVEDFDD